MDASAGSDLYGLATAEFYDLVAAGMWDEFGPLLTDLLAAADPSVGPLVDVGVGTGFGLGWVRAALPGAPVWAIEPSKAMRTALHARLSIDAGLRANTTVVPHTFADAPLPPRACALLLSAALGHLTDAERERLWRYVADALPPGAPAVIGVLPPDRPLTVPLVRYHRADVGTYAYEGWQSGEPSGERTMRWELVYRVLDREAGDALVAEHVVRSEWRCDGVDDVRAEIEPFGLELTEHHDCVVVSRPARPARATSPGAGSDAPRG